MRRRILRLRRFNWRWTLAFTRKPPGGRTVEGVKYLDCSLKPGGFRASRPRSASDYAWLRTSAHKPSTAFFLISCLIFGKDGWSREAIFVTEGPVAQVFLPRHLHLGPARWAD